MLDLEKTISKVRECNPRFEHEDESQYNARTLHLSLLAIENGLGVLVESQEPEAEPIAKKQGKK